MTAARRLCVTTLVVAGGCLAGMALCPRVWTSERNFPVIPVVAGLHAAPGLEGALLWSFVAAVVASAAWVRGRAAKAVAIGLGAVLVALDQSRLQPWLYQYVLMLGLLACRRGPVDDRSVLGTLRLVIAFLYAYSALHKLNASFFHETGPLFLRPIAGHLPNGLIPWLVYPIPAIEFALAPLLLWPRSRNLGVAFAAGMHTIILLLLGPWGANYNSVVWPWNAAMVAIVIALFFGRDMGSAESAATTLAKPARPSGLAAGARVAGVFLSGVLPVAGLAGYLDLYLSWCMYGSAPTLAGVQMSPAMIARLPEPLRAEVQTLPRGFKGIVILDWSMHDMNVVRTEPRILRRAAQALAPYAREPGDARLVMMHAPHWWTGVRRREDTPLEGAP